MAQRDDISGLDTLDALAREAERAAGNTAPVAVESLPSVSTVHYEVLGEHGRGGMGRVLVALDRRLGRPVAIKELLSAKPEATARFVREALVTARLQHPSIVPVHEAGRWPDDKPFYAMKLVQGRPLDALVRSAPDFAARLALLPSVIAVAEAVAYAHSRRVIHRDLKPANVVVGEFGETILLDWGLAKELGPDETSVAPSQPARPGPGGDGAPGQTLDGSVVGTPGFMSPEQAAGDPVDVRTDVYALGAMLYNLLTGEIPLKSRAPLEILQQTVDGKLVPVRDREPRVPDELVDILHKSMARRPDDRYPSARELADDLKRFQTGQLVAAHRYSTSELVRRWLRRHRAVVATVTAALALVAASATISVRRVVRERDRAEAAQRVAESARQREAARVDELVVANARAVIDHDPTGALAWLKRLRPGSSRWPAAALVAGDAQRRGVAERHQLAHAGGALTLSFSPDGKWIASGGADGAVRLWSPSGGEPTLLGPVPGEITALEFLPDGKRLLAAGSKGRLQLWDLDTRAALVMEGRGAITALAISPDSTRAASGDDQGLLRLWQLPTGEPRGTATVGRAITSVAFSPDGARVAARADGVVRTYKTASLSPELDAALPGDGQLVFAVDGTLAVGGEAQVRLWSPAGRARSLALGGRATHLAVSPDGHRLAATSDDGAVMWWELDGASPAHPLAHRGDASRDIAFSHDGTRLGATRGDTARIWSLPGADPRKLRGPSQEVTRLRFSPDGGRVVTCALDGGVWIYRLGAGLLPAEPEPPQKEAPLRAWLDTVTDAVVSE